MHPEAHDFVARAVAARGPFDVVIEIGGRDINGTVRPLFGVSDYTSIDLYDGPGVDVVADAAVWMPEMPAQADCVVCAEVLEHAANGMEIVRRAWWWLRPRGLLIVTCATDPRAPHSAIDGNLLEPGSDEFYRNVSMDTMLEWASVFTSCEVEIDADHGDLYAIAEK